MSIFVFISIYIYKLKFMSLFKGAGGTPWDQIIGNEFENLSDRGAGHGGHLAEKILFYSELSRLPCGDFPVVTRQRLAKSLIISKLGF